MRKGNNIMDNTLNIEEIMQEIRNEIKEKGLSSDMLSFEDISYSNGTNGSKSLSQEATDSLGYINLNYNIQSYRVLEGSAIKTFIKKVIRKLTKFYVEPVVFDQNVFNAHVVRVINSMHEILSTETDEQKAVNNRIETLELKQKELSKQIIILKEENALLKEQLKR